MQRLLSLTAFALVLGNAPLLRSAEPAADLASYSHFKDIDLSALYEGTVLAERGTPLSSSRGLASQACYLARKPLAFTQKFLIAWDPTPHAEMQTYFSRNFSSENDANFDQLKFTRTDRPTSLLLDETRKSRPENLFLSADEIAILKKTMSNLPSDSGEVDNPVFRQSAANFWSGILRSRFLSYKQGGIASLPTISSSEDKLNVAKEVRSMLNDASGIQSHFKDLLADTALRSGGQPPAPVTYYWQLFKADTTATLCLGAFYAAPGESSAKLLDLQFFASNSYLTTLTLYELYPVKVNGQDCTLIWRGDFVSAPDFASYRGVEQMAARMLLSQSVKESVQFFLADIHKTKTE